MAIGAVSRRPIGDCEGLRRRVRTASTLVADGRIGRGSLARGRTATPLCLAVLGRSGTEGASTFGCSRRGLGRDARLARKGDGRTATPGRALTPSSCGGGTST